MFGWAGEINVFKHALAANGFFANGERVSEARVARGDLDGFFRRMEDMKVNIFTLICVVHFNCDIFFSQSGPRLFTATSAATTTTACPGNKVSNTSRDTKGYMNYLSHWVVRRSRNVPEHINN